MIIDQLQAVSIKKWIMIITGYIHLEMIVDQ